MDLGEGGEGGRYHTSNSGGEGGMKSGEAFFWGFGVLGFLGFWVLWDLGFRIYWF